MAYKYKNCSTCGGRGKVHVLHNWETCLSCAGIGMRYEHVPDKFTPRRSKSRNTWSPNKSKSTSSENNIEEGLGGLAGLAVSIYLYYYGYCGGWEALIYGIIVGVIVRYTIKWFLFFGLLYLIYLFLQ